MPIVDLTPPDLSAPIGVPQGFAVTPGENDLSDNAPGFGSVVGAAFRQDNTVGAYLSSNDRDMPSFKEDGFNPWDAIKGTKYEAQADSFWDVRNSRAAGMRKMQIDREEADRKTIDAAPWYQSLPAQMLAGVVDWPTLLPGGAFVRVANGGISVARSALMTGTAAGASTAVQELALQGIQSTRSGGESAINIGAGVLLGGLLGAGGAKLLSRAEWDTAVQALERDFTAEPRGFETYHGSNNLFENFSDDRIGGGFGTTYGHGHSLAELPSDAQTYGSNVYKVRVNADQDKFIDWDKPLAEQSAFVRKALDGLAEEDQTGGDFYRMLSPASIGGGEFSDEAASRALSDLGIVGIKHIHQNADKGAPNNFVVFRAQDLSILDRNGNESGSISAPRSIGAAANTAADLTDNSIAGAAAAGIASTTARLNPLLRILHSPSAMSRDVGTQLFENPLYLKKNYDGVASEPAVETFMKEWNGGLAKAIGASKSAFTEYVKANGGGVLERNIGSMATRSGLMTRSEFNERVSAAMRRGDTDADPFVTKAAAEYRVSVFEPLKKAAIEAKLLPPDVSVETAESYLTRMWNGRAISADEQGFKGMVMDWVRQKAPEWQQQFDRTAQRRLEPLSREIDELEMAKLRRAEELKQRQAASPHAGLSNEDVKTELEKWVAGMGEGARLDVLPEAVERFGERTRSQMTLYRGEWPGRPDLGNESGTLSVSDRMTGESFAISRNDVALEDGPDGRILLSEIQIPAGTKVLDATPFAGNNTKELERILPPGKFVVEGKRLEPSNFEAPYEITTYRFEPTQRVDVADTSEMSEADIRQALRIVNGGAPKPKGVKTLSQFVLEAGGLVDDAGELAHRGITNKARPGLIRKERRSQFSGDKGGWTLDDMARHAWENGYFPHRGDSRPSVDEFVEAMNDDFHKIRAVLKAGEEDAYALSDMVARLEADLSRAGIGGDNKARFSTSEEMKGAVERVYKAMDAEADNKIAVLRDRLKERETDIRVDRESRFVGEPDEMGREIANEVFDTLTGRAGGGPVPTFITIKARGPLKERTFNIPDLFTGSNGRSVEGYLENDVEHIARRYTRVMGADVELSRKFGSVDMVDQIGRIREDYARLRAGVTNEQELLKLTDRETADIRDLEAVRDMLRGTNPGSPAEENYSRFVRSVNHFNYLRSMGEVAIASLTEVVRPAMVHGLTPYMETLGQTLSNMKGIKLSVGEAQLAGNVVERVLGTRLATLSEIVDPYASRGPMEAFLENMTNVASKWNGIRLLTDMQKSIASVMTQNRLLEGASRFSEAPPQEKAYLAFMGIDQSMAERIAAQFAAHGETIEKVRVANTEKWTDQVAMRAYRAAINKDVDSIITTKGVADTPLFANTPTGRAVLQFKSFALASHQRVLLRGLQEDQTRFLGGVIAMTTIGMMTTWLKAQSGNRPERLQDPAKNPGWWIAEGLDKSGIFAVPTELSNMFEKGTGLNPIKAPIKAFDEGSAQSQKNQNRSLLGSLVGPTAGLIDDGSSILNVPQKVIAGEEVTQGQKNAAERLLPFSSYVGVRQMLRYVVNPQTP